MVKIHGHKTTSANVNDLGVTAIGGAAELSEIRALAASVHLSDELVGYIVDLIRSTRSTPALRTGASPRSANMLASASRAFAVLEGRDFVIPDDIKRLFPPTLRHRVLLSPDTELEGVSSDHVLAQILDRVPAPR